MNAWINHHGGVVIAVYLAAYALGFLGHLLAKWQHRRAEANLRRQETETGIARLEQYANTGKASL